MKGSKGMWKSLVKLNVLVRLNWYGKLLCTKILELVRNLDKLTSGGC